MDVKPNLASLSTFDQPISEGSVPGNVPAFLLKLWKLVEDKKLDHIIAWSQKGQTFKVHDQIAFAKDILPKYYKHSNFSSFVRQVNMYGFRKIVDAASGGLKHDKDEWEFFHQSFQQNKPNLLQLIKRKAPTKENDGKTAQVNALLSEVGKLKLDHESVASKLENVRTENQLLWREVGDLRQQHRDQQAVINKLIQMFIKIVMNNKKDIPRGTKRRALNFSVNDNKFARPSQDVLPYNSTTQGQVSQEILPYNSNNQTTVFNQYESLPTDTLYSVESPKSPFRLTEFENADNNHISVIEEAPLSNFTAQSMEHDDDVTPIIIDPATSASAIHTIAQSASSKITNVDKSPLIVKSNDKTITIVRNADARKTNSKKSNAVSDGFIFPFKYEEKINTDNVTANKCLNMNASDISFECIKALDEQSNVAVNDDIITVLPSDRQELSTPDTLAPPPPPPKVMSLLPANDTLSTPIVNIPPTVSPKYTRQISFKDRDEISDNVLKINKSIEHLQDILDHQSIVNLDFKNLNLLSEHLPDNLSMQDIASAFEAANSSPDLAITAPQINQQGQRDKYQEEPMSPSEYMDPEYATLANTEFLDSVLQGHQHNSGTSS